MHLWIVEWLQHFKHKYVPEAKCYRKAKKTTGSEMILQAAADMFFVNIEVLIEEKKFTILPARTEFFKAISANKIALRLRADNSWEAF